MLKLISAVLVFGEVKGASIVLQENVETKEIKEPEPELKGFFGFIDSVIKKIGSFVTGVIEKLDYEIVQGNIECYTNASEEYKAEVIKILCECDEKLQALEKKYEQQEAKSCKD